MALFFKFKTMADSKTIIYSVDIEYGNLVKNSEDIKTKIKDLTIAQTNLDTSSKENQKTYRENTTQLKMLQSQLKLNETEVNKFTESEKANTDATNFNNNSIKQNRELLKGLTAEYIKLQNPTEEQTKKIKALSDTLKAQEGAIGDTRRSVGNYKESFQSAIGQFPAFQKGIEGVSNGFKALSAGNPFTLILMALTPLIQSFLKLEPVTNAINGVFEGLTSAITTIVSSIKNFFDLMSSGAGFFDSISQAFGGLGGKMKSAAIEGYNLVQALDDLEDAERSNQASMAKTNRDVAILIAQSKDRTKTERERIDLLKEANRLEEEQLKKDLNIANTRVAVTAHALAVAIRTGKDRDTAEQNLADAQQKRFEAEQASGVQTEKNQGRINGLIQSEDDLRQKGLDKQKKRIEENKKILDDFVKKVTESLNEEQKIRVEQFANDKLLTQMANDEKLLSLKESFANGTLTEKQYQDQIKEQQLAFYDAQIADLEEYNGITGAYDDEITKLKIDKQNAVTDNKIVNIEKQKELDAQKFELDLEYATITAQTDQEKRDQEILNIEAQNAQILKNTKLTEEQKRNEIAKNAKAIEEIEKASTKARIANIMQLANVMGQISELLGKNTEEGKAFAVAQTIISTYASAQQAYASQIIPGDPTSPVRGAILAGLAIIQGLKRVREITAIEVPKPTPPPPQKTEGFAEGGLVGFASGGLSGTKITSGMGIPIRRRNGDNLLATVKTGEVILNQKQQAMLGGSSTFSRIGVPGFANGGMILPDITSPNFDLMESFRNMQLVVSAVEITNVQNRLKVMEDTTSL
jgi:hypothetical protein